MIEKSNAISGQYEINCFVDTELVKKVKSIKEFKKYIQENIEKSLDKKE